MRRIAHGELRGDGKRLDPSSMLLDDCGKLSFVQRSRLLPVVIVPAADDRHRHARKRPGYSGALRHRCVEADEHHAYGRPVPLDYGVGGKGG